MTDVIVGKDVAFDREIGGQKRRYLFLQGPIGRFFNELAFRLRRSGHQVHRINFNGGDRIFWRLPKAVDFRDGADRWAGFLAERLSDWRITDIVLFGDCRPLHRRAVQLARLRGIAVHVFEEGYLRPNWITLESGGVNNNSNLPRDPEWFKAHASGLPPWSDGKAVTGSFVRRAREDVLYNVGTVLMQWRYPGYRTHKPWHPLVEYAAGARRFPFKRLICRRAAAAANEVLSRKRPYYLFPLQLDADSQIRFHSQFGRMAPAIRLVIDSFSRFAPDNAELVVTEHPLDWGVVKLERITANLAVAAGVSERVRYLQGGSSNELLRHCRGLVTVNSTAGILGLNFGVPVLALGRPIYDMPGLTFQGGLDDFWRLGTPPDANTFDAFRRVVAARTQLNGGFYSPIGLSYAVDAAVARLEASPRDSSVTFSQPSPGRDAVGASLWDAKTAVPE